MTRSRETATRLRTLVMLNRAPTLHRLGIQAFEPVLIEGKAIRITSYNVCYTKLLRENKIP